MGDGAKTIFNGTKSKTETLVDVVLDKTAGAAGKKIASSATSAVASTKSAVESSNKALRSAENTYNKVTDGGKNGYGVNATVAKQRLSDARANVQAAAVQQAATKTVNMAVNSTVGKVAGKAVEISMSDKVKNWFGF